LGFFFDEPKRRFPPPWTVQDIGAAFVIKDSNGQKFGYLYYEEEAGRAFVGQVAQQRRGASDCSQLCEAAGAVAEGKVMVWAFRPARESGSSWK
jgi:hypothetical protein